MPQKPLRIKELVYSAVFCSAKECEIAITALIFRERRFEVKASDFCKMLSERQLCEHTRTEISFTINKDENRRDKSVML